MKEAEKFNIGNALDNVASPYEHDLRTQQKSIENDETHKKIEKIKGEVKEKVYDDESKLIDLAGPKGKIKNLEKVLEKSEFNDERNRSHSQKFFEEFKNKIHPHLSYDLEEGIYNSAESIRKMYVENLEEGQKSYAFETLSQEEIPEERDEEDHVISTLDSMLEHMEENMEMGIVDPNEVYENVMELGPYLQKGNYVGKRVQNPQIAESISEEYKNLKDLTLKYSFEKGISDGYEHHNGAKKNN